MLVATHAANTRATVESFILGDVYLLPFLAHSAGALWNTRRCPQSVNNPLIRSPEQRRCSESETAVNCQLSLEHVSDRMVRPKLNEPEGLPSKGHL